MNYTDIKLKLIAHANELTDEQLAKFKAGQLEFIVSYADDDVRIENIEGIYGMPESHDN